MENMNKFRKPNYLINKIFLNRWSPRAMSDEEVTDEELMTLFEAARWAPSSYNTQPWRFIYAKKNTENWNIFFNLLVEFNKSWAKNAAVLVCIISKKTHDLNNQPAPTHSFDAGSAWENLALQASINNIVAHGMEGFDYEKARKVLKVPNEFQVEAMFALGKPGSTENLPKELQEREKPSTRKELKEIVVEGIFSWN